MTTAFRLFFSAPDGVKQQCEPWNTEELPREFGFIGNMETKEQWFGTRHHCAREPAADGPTGWPADDALAGCASFRAAVLEAMALYDRVCRLVLGLVVGKALGLADGAGVGASDRAVIERDLDPAHWANVLFSSRNKN